MGREKIQKAWAGTNQLIDLAAHTLLGGLPELSSGCTGPCLLKDVCADDACSWSHASISTVLVRLHCPVLHDAVCVRAQVRFSQSFDDDGLGSDGEDSMRRLSSKPPLAPSGGSVSLAAQHFCPVCGIIATSQANLEVTPLQTRIKAPRIAASPRHEARHRCLVILKTAV